MGAESPSDHAASIQLPGGEFLMGSNAHYLEERPAHRRRVDAFAMDEIRVTNADFTDFVSATGYATVAERPLDPALYPVTLELKDPEFAVYAVLTGDEPALLRGDTQKRCRAAIRDDRENPYFDGTVIPQEIRLVCGQ